MPFCSRSADVTAQDSLYSGTVHVLVMRSASQHSFMIQMIDSKHELQGSRGEIKVVSPNWFAKSTCNRSQINLGFGDKTDSRPKRKAIPQENVSQHLKSHASPLRNPRSTCEPQRVSGRKKKSRRKLWKWSGSEKLIPFVAESPFIFNVWVGADSVNRRASADSPGWAAFEWRERAVAEYGGILKDWWAEEDDGSVSSLKNWTNPSELPQRIGSVASPPQLPITACCPVKIARSLEACACKALLGAHFWAFDFPSCSKTANSFVLKPFLSFSFLSLFCSLCNSYLHTHTQQLPLLLSSFGPVRSVILGPECPLLVRSGTADSTLHCCERNHAWNHSGTRPANLSQRPSSWAPSGASKGWELDGWSDRVPYP